MPSVPSTRCFIATLVALVVLSTLCVCAQQIAVPAVPPSHASNEGDTTDDTTLVMANVRDHVRRVCMANRIAHHRCHTLLDEVPEVSRGEATSLFSVAGHPEAGLVREARVAVYVGARVGGLDAMQRPPPVSHRTLCP